MYTFAQPLSRALGIELRTEPLPRSAAGKILKRELREPHWAGQQAQVSGG